MGIRTGDSVTGLEAIVWGVGVMGSGLEGGERRRVEDEGHGWGM